MHLRLEITDAHRTELRLELLCRRRLRGHRRAAHDVGNARHLVDRRLDGLALGVELTQSQGRRLQRKPGDRLFEPAAGRGQHLLGVLKWHQLAVIGLGHRLDVEIVADIATAWPQLAHQLGDAASDVVQLVNQARIDRIRADRRQAVDGRHGVKRPRQRKEALKAQWDFPPAAITAYLGTETSPCGERRSQILIRCASLEIQGLRVTHALSSLPRPNAERYPVHQIGARVSPPVAVKERSKAIHGTSSHYAGPRG